MPRDLFSRVLMPTYLIDSSPVGDLLERSQFNGSQSDDFFFLIVISQIQHNAMLFLAYVRLLAFAPTGHSLVDKNLGVRGARLAGKCELRHTFSTFS